MKFEVGIENWKRRFSKIGADNRKSKIENLFIATGHYRNGVLFSAITSDLLLKIVQNKNLKEIEKSFTDYLLMKTADTEYKSTIENISDVLTGKKEPKAEEKK